MNPEKALSLEVGFAGVASGIHATQSLYFQSQTHIANNELNWFPVAVGFCQGCPLSSVLSINYTDRIFRPSQVIESVRFSDHRIPALLFALLASPGRDLQFPLGQCVSL